ncbi:MAG TPA: copper-translocating P-type ATPase [Gammaproteobacteria bacterium]|nr:copper-translocating P-type ATPase [Gammaproteobacteria bacterium]
MKATVEFFSPDLQRIYQQAGHTGLPIGLAAEPAFENRLQNLRIGIRGMNCASCVVRIEKSLRNVSGVTAAVVNFATATAYISYDPSKIHRNSLRQVIVDSGYEAVDPTPATVDGIDHKDAEAAQEYQTLMRKFWFAVAISLPNIIFMYPDIIPGLAAMIPFESIERRIVWVVLGLLTLWVLAWSGSQFFRGMMTALRHHAADMHALIAIGISATFIYSVLATLFPGLFSGKTAAEPFWDVVTVVTALVVLGLAMESKVRARTCVVIQSLIGLQPTTAKVLRDGNTEVGIPVEEVIVGDRILIRSGDKIPVDGSIILGRSVVDESMITGESTAVEKMPGAEVFAGTINEVGSFQFLATRVGKETALSNIISRVQDAQNSKVPVQRFVDQVSGYFVPTVLLLGVFAFVVWYGLGPQPRLVFSLIILVTTLLIASPKALGLATSTSLIAGVGKAAQHGILIRSGDVLQTAQRLNTVILDKTGTITRGKPELTDVIVMPGFDDDEILSQVAALERSSEHPLAEAIVNGAFSRGLRLSESTNFMAIAGQGVRGQVAGRTVVLGNAKLLRENAVETRGLEDVAEALAPQGKTSVLVAIDGQPAAIIAVADQIKEDSKVAISMLKEMGLEVIMLTGDNQMTAQAIAAQVGVGRVLAEVLPEEKDRQVQALQQEGKIVAMVGDGINDAPALASADIGLAIGVGTDVAFKVSDITLIKGNLMGVATAIDVSRATMRNVRQNLLGAFGYNLVGLPIAMGVFYPLFGVLISPILASAAMALSSVTVVSNANRLRFFKPIGIPT